MRLLGRDAQELRSEQRLLRQVAALARRCECRLPARLLDDVLAGTGGVRPMLPSPRERSS